MSNDSTRYVQMAGYRYYDKPVNPDLYLVRPGDILTVTFINANLPQLQLVVDPENRIIDGTLGIFNLTGKTLAQTRALLSKKLLDLYNVNRIAISVGNPQKVAVFVSGAVNAPGLYTAYTSQRVSEIIDSAKGITSFGSRRWIQFSGGPDVLMVDLDRASYLGDDKTNPCLYAGYAVYVPSKSDKRVQVIGEVNRPREIELVPDDDIPVLIQLSGGVRSTGDTSSITIIRAASEYEVTADYMPQAGDVLIVPAKKDNEKFQQVALFGAVKKPGYYEYEKTISIPQLIDKAGGYVETANLHQTVIFRLGGVDAWGRISSVRYPLMSINGDRDYLQSFSIQPGDSVFIPNIIGYVTVSGMVRNPGLFPFSTEKDIEYYVNIAGGLLPLANEEEIAIYHRFSRITEIGNLNTQVYDGDRITVKALEGTGK